MVKAINGIGQLSPIYVNAYDQNDINKPLVKSTFAHVDLGAENNTDPCDCLGDLYQWGRQKDGHQLRNSPTTTILATSLTPNNNYFILAPISPFDWLSGSSNNTRWGDGTQNMDMPKAMNDPCPAGWKIPSQKQWASLLKGEATAVSGATILADGTGLANKWTWIQQ